jgi:TfoX/Sxy family transcriptional regulator of competence genes
MAYSEALADRIRVVLDGRGDVVEKKMFGGIAFMIAGTMACGVLGEDLMARVGPDRFDDTLTRPHTRPMDFTGRPSRGMVYVGPAGIRSAAQLKRWVEQVVEVALASPTKKKTKTRKKKAVANPKKRA